MASNSGRTPTKVVNKGGSTQPRSGGSAPKTGGGTGSTKPVGSPTATVRKTGATNNGGSSRGARGNQK